jgi:membrane protease subunit (stomatin/prohibitin family)/Zn-finger nucleic acid-binding protein
VRLGQFLVKQPLDVIQWNEPEPDILAYRYPMFDMDIQAGAKLTVRESEMAVFVDQGRIADVFGPGLYTLNTVNLPLLTALKDWHAGFESPFKTDLYFFSTHLEIDQKWGASTSITLRDKEFGTLRLRSYGIYSYRLADPRTFFDQVSGTRESYSVYDLDDQLRNTIVARMTETVAASGISSLDLIANRAALSDKVAEQVNPVFAALGLKLTQFTVQNISLPDDHQMSLDQRIGLADAFTADAIHSSIDTNSCMSCSCCSAPMRTDNGIFKCDHCHNVVVPEAGNDGVSATTESEGSACPVCSIPLMQATIGSASLLYCTRCDGMLVAMGQFETLIAASRALPGGPIPLQPANPADRQHRFACPQCRRPMQAHCYGDAGNVVIDTCERCSLNWLDHNKLARIAHAPAFHLAAESNAANCAIDSGAYFAAPQAAQSVGYDNSL